MAVAFLVASPPSLLVVPLFFPAPGLFGAPEPLAARLREFLLQLGGARREKTTPPRSLVHPLGEPAGLHRGRED